MQSLNFTTGEALVAGGVLGGFLAGIGVFALIAYILMIIAWWKIFEKAGEAGWKSLIPIYNVYILCRIINFNFWYYIILVPVLLGILGAIFKEGFLGSLVGFATGLYTLWVEVFTAIKLGRAFKKSTLFKLGLIFFPNIFALILGFGLSKYHGKKA
ncbi:hypothetical protein IJ380_00225 [Candidatus Saccharibacteria bacterium]|nr:hypothetical protein [Candidatus Saccharibacteria bacterium]